MPWPRERDVRRLPPHVLGRDLAEPVHGSNLPRDRHCANQPQRAADIAVRRSLRVDPSQQAVAEQWYGDPYQWCSFLKWCGDRIEATKHQLHGENARARTARTPAAFVAHPDGRAAWEHSAVFRPSTGRLGPGWAPQNSSFFAARSSRVRTLKRWPGARTNSGSGRCPHGSELLGAHSRLG